MGKKKDKKAKKENKMKDKGKEAVAVKKKKKEKKVVTKGKIYVKSTYNNTLVTVTDLTGNVLSTSSGGVVGFTGTKKATAYAATKAAEDAVMKAQKYGIKEAVVMVRGAGLGRQAAVKGLRSGGLRISLLMDTTRIPHGGVKPEKRPRK